MSNTQALAVRAEGATDLQHAYEPTSFTQLVEVCRTLFASGLLPKSIMKLEAAVLIAIRGRELGLSLGQSFSSIHVIDGKTVLSADLIVARIRRSGHCKLWRVDVCTNEECKITAQRADDSLPLTMSWTIKDAERAGLLSKQNWRQYPRAMLRARVSAELARAVFPEEALGMYDPDEISSAANDNDVPPVNVTVEVLGEVVPPVSQAPNEPLRRKQSEVAREWAAKITGAQSREELLEIRSGFEAIPFKGTIRGELEQQWEARLLVLTLAKTVPDPPESAA